jgi:4-amino-4-deoxy-L-arabinose transferase-like glycosyltransferase
MEQMAVARPAARPPVALPPAIPQRLAVLALGEIVLFYLVTRLGLIGRLPWFVDEGSHGAFVDRVAHNLHDAFVSLSIAKEPLAIWIATVFAKLGFSPLTATRIVSLLAGLLTLAMVGLIARRLAGIGPALAAMALYAALPLFLVHDVVGIMDPLLTALMTSALYLQLELAARPRLAPALGLAAALGLGILTKEGAKGAVLLLPLSLLCFDWHSPDVRRRLARWAGYAAIGLAGALAGWLLLRSSALWEKAQAIRQVPLLYPVRDVGDALSDPWRWIRENWPVYRDTFTGYVTVPVLVAGVAGFVLTVRERPRPALVVAGWFAVLLAAALLLPVSPYPRHALFLVPLLVVFAGVALARGGAVLHRALGGTRAAAAAVAVALALVLGPALWLDARVLAHPDTVRYPGRDDVQYVTGVQAGAPWPAVADELRRRTRPGEPVIRSRAAVDVLSLLLEGRNPFVFGDRPAARRARVLVRDDLPFPDPAGERLLALRGPGAFVLGAEFPRPRGGSVVRIYERPR